MVFKRVVVLQFLCAQLAGMGMNIYANAFIARLTAGAPPPPGPPPVIGPPFPPAEPPGGGEAAGEAGPGFYAPVEFHVAPPAPAAPAPGAGAPPAPAVDEEVAPPPPEAPNVREGRRVLGGPRLPDRRPQRRPAGPLAAVQAQHAMGPDTPQSDRDPPRVVADVEEHADVAEEEREGALVEIAPPAAHYGAEIAGAGINLGDLLDNEGNIDEGEDNNIVGNNNNVDGDVVEEVIGDIGHAPPMPPATPPTAGDSGPRD